ncbi:hypothetical protein HXX76_013935 [Chlamydomonas incerta]|uniref:Uncharacterized protein n=1 Tax=Chlamydomonas incerta TaxID=51695 RepID=A0A835SSN8_CHLIN|nr:hypothetical protein HXX76_013935 [Chlamydomonas incerta]|eukprot:KAG2425181.1 hypothetical protein HXX76_013935 [Chlamydomonas incerta]
MASHGEGAPPRPLCPLSASPEPCSSSARFTSLGRYSSQRVGFRGCSPLAALAEAASPSSSASHLRLGHLLGQHHQQQQQQQPQQPQQPQRQQVRAYHPWYYGSRLRSRAIAAAGSLEELGRMLQAEGHRMDHINLTNHLAQLKRVAQAAEAEAVAEATSGSSSSSSSSAGGGGEGKAGSPAATAVTAAASAAASRAVRAQVLELAAEAAVLVRRRAKWYDPRYAALTVAHTAALGYADDRLLNAMTGRVLARLNEAYSRDLLLLLRGLAAHAQLPSAAAAYAAATGSSSGSSSSGGSGWTDKPEPLPYSGAPAVLLGGVKLFLAAKVPTGRVPPENLDGLLRHFRALAPPNRRLGPAVCGAVMADLQARLAIYAPAPLAGVLSTLSAERQPLPPPLLDAAAEQFAAHALTHGSGAAAARFLAAAGAQLRLQQQQQQEGEAAAAAAAGGAAAEGAVQGGAEWLARHPQLLAACLELMTRDLPGASLDRVARWLQPLARLQAPLASTAAAAAAAPGSVDGAAAAAAAAFLRAHAAAVERELPRLRLPVAGAGAGAAAPAAAVAGGSVQQRLRASYEVLRLPLPQGL